MYTKLRLKLKKKTAPSYLCELVALLCRALCLAGWVAQGEDDWPLVEGRHGFDDALGKSSSDGSHSCGTTWPRYHTPASGRTLRPLRVRTQLVRFETRYLRGQFIPGVLGLHVNRVFKLEL